MENQHKKIAGYRDLSADEIALMNRIKDHEAGFNALIDDLKAMGSSADQRNVSIAQTEGESAYMRAVRAVAQPERIVKA
jgi:hypothetical protein